MLRLRAVVLLSALDVFPVRSGCSSIPAKHCLVKEDALKRSEHSLFYRHIKGQLHRGEKCTKTPFSRLFQEVKIDIDKYLARN